MSDESEEKETTGAVPFESVNGSPAEEIPQPDATAQHEQALFDHNERKFKDELGWFGKIFGGRREKSGNIAAITIIISLAFLIGAFLLDAYDKSGTIEFGVILSALISIITLALGYLFGSNDTNSD